jgi:hypothetical protein
VKNKYEIRGNIVVIFLKRKNGDDLETIIDVDDLERVASFKGRWYPHWDKNSKSYYAKIHIYNQNGKRISIHLSRVVCGQPINKDIDHKDHNTLNNCRKTNLRILSTAENQQNRKGPNCNNHSGFLGVYWSKTREKWIARGFLNGKSYYLGIYKNIDDAVTAREKWKADNMPFAA